MLVRSVTVALVLLLAACTAPPAGPSLSIEPAPARALATEAAATAKAEAGPISTGAPLSEVLALTPTAAPVPPSATPPPTAPASSTPGQLSETRALSPTEVPPPAAETLAQALSAHVPNFKHVFIIVMENKESGSILGGPAAPYMNELAKQYAYAAAYFGIRHPSLPNYLALTGGGTFAVTSDCTTCFVAADNIVSQMEKAGISWKAYMESMPEPCYRGPDTDLYARRHNPFFYFNNIRTNPSRCEKIVPFEQFQADLAANTLPRYVWITPNLCHDMHDCPVASGDDWLKTWVPQILASNAWQDNGVLFITFDEGISNAGCCQYATGGRISTLVISPLVKKGFVSDVPYDHHSLLRTIEQAWGLPPLDRAACDCSLPMSDFFETP